MGLCNVTTGAVLVALLLALPASGSTEAEGANPLRKIVNLLQNLRHEVEAEGEKSKELYEKFMCYCETTDAATTKSIDEGRSHVTSLEAEIKELSGSNAQLEQEVKDLKEDIEENTKGVEEATAARKKEQSEYTAEAADTTNSISALDKAIPALEKGLAPPAALLTEIAARLLAKDRMGGGGAAGDRAQLLQTILLQMQNGEQQPSGGSAQILGVLGQMRDDFKANLATCTKEEEEAQATYDELMAAKGKQITASTRELEEKSARLAGQKQSLANAEEDLEDTSKTLAQDEKFLYNLKTNCATKTKEFEAEEKERQLEVVAIADTIKILNDDDAQEMFKKTLPSPAGAAGAASFLQTRMRTRYGYDSDLPPNMAEASRLLQEAGAQGGSHAAEMRLVAAQIRHRGRQPDSFAPLKNSVSQMIAALGQEQQDDDKHREYCKAEMDRVGDEKASLTSDIEGMQTKMTDAQASMNTLNEEISSLKTELQVLDANAVQAAAQRKQESDQHTQTMSELQVSSALLDKAKERLSQFYAPKGASLLQQQESSTENERWAQSLLSLGQDDSSANGGGDSSLLQVSQPGGRGAAGGMIVGMLETLKGELKTSMAVAKQEEADAQKDYDQFSSDTAASVESKKKQVVDKEGNLATIAEALQDLSTSKDESNTELTAVLSKLAALTSDCSFLLENYDIRKKARGQEMESLNNALAILSGADLSFVQLQSVAHKKRVLRHGRVQ